MRAKPPRLGALPQRHSGGGRCHGTLNRRAPAAILYAELRNFTRLSEVLPPGEGAELANEFFSFCGMAVTAEHGKVLSVQNDALLGAFGTGARKDFAERVAEGGAGDLQREFGTLGEQWKTRVRPAGGGLAAPCISAKRCSAWPARSARSSSSPSATASASPSAWCTARAPARSSCRSM